MKRNKNKIKLLLSTVLLLGSFSAFCQQLFTYQQSPILSSQQQKYAQVWIAEPSTGAFAYATFDESALLANVLSFNSPDGQLFQVTKDEVVYRSENDYSWFGSGENYEGKLSLVVHDEMLTGFFQMKNNKWRILPLGNGLHIIYQVNSSEFEDESADDYQNMLKQTLEIAPLKGFDPEAGDAFAAGDCKIRVFVAYTNAAETSMGADVNGFIQSCIDVTNQCYSNSSVSFEVELARSQKVSYTESGSSSTDKSRFRNTADGYMDEIHTTRTYYDADLNVLLVSTLESGICGSAYTVAISPYTDAFCVCRVSCAVDNYSFPHELGHLYGCRHDQYVDGTDDPYSYGHGYVYKPDEWRTVMAYNDDCEDSGFDCDRLPYFSNPSVTYFGDAMGVSGENDNELALENSKDNIAGLETTVSSKILPDETIDDDEKGDVIASTSVTNSGSYVVSNGADMTWRAGSYILLDLDFHAIAGSDFHGFIDACDALRISNEEAAIEQTAVEENNLQAFPNPFSESTTINITLGNDALVTIRLLDVLGNQISDIADSGYYPAGEYNFVLQNSELVSGMYMIEAKINGEQQLLRVLKIE